MKYFIIVITIFIASCTTNGNNSFDILDDAKKLIAEITGSSNLEKNEREKFDKTKKVIKSQNSIKDKEKTELIEKNEKILVEETKEEVYAKKDNKSKKNIQSRLLKKEKLHKKFEEEYPKNNINIEDYHIKDITSKSNTNKIGVLLPLSGDKSNIGANILNGLELALFQNQEKNIELIIRDTKADPQHTRKAFEELLSLDVKTIIGPLYTKSLLSIEEKASDQNIKIFALTNNTNVAKKGIWIFGIDPEQQAEKILKFSYLKGNKKFAALLPNNSYGFLLKDVIEKTLNSFNLKPVLIEFFNNNIKDQEEAAKKISKGFLAYEKKLSDKEKEDIIKSKDNEILIPEQEIIIPFDSVFIAASGQDLTIIASQLQYNGVDPKKVSFLGTAAWENNNILREPALEGGFYSTTSDSYKGKIKNIFKNVYNIEMSNISMIAYDILALLGEGFKENKQFKSNFFTKQTGFIGLRGLFRLTDQGKVERVFQIKKITNKKFITFEKEPERFANNLN